MKFDFSNLKIFSAIGARASFGLILNNLAKTDEDLIVVTADVSTSAGLDRFKKNYKKRLIDVGIAEQNLIGIATGLSSVGYKSITTTFSPFQTLRCLEQIKVNLSYMKEKVIMVGLASGLCLGNLGFTHCSIDDIGALRSLPNITIISPADCYELYKTIIASLKHKNSVYIRLTGDKNLPIIYKKDYQFSIGEPIEIKKGKDVCLFSNGAILNEAIKCSEFLSKKGISVNVVNVHTIKPLNQKKILKFIKKKKLILTLEEHNIIGGLGSAIAEIMSDGGYKTKLIRLGVNDNYVNSGSYEYLKNKYKLTEKHVSRVILDKIKN